jgi:hypothetical protein
VEDAPAWSDLAPIVVAVVAAIAAITGQYLLNRREPFAIVRLKKLSEAIDSLPEGDTGRSSLEKARTILALRLSKALIGPQGLARVFRVAAWAMFALGSVIVVVWLFAIGVLGKDGSTQDAQAILLLGIVFLVASPVFLLYSAVWPYMWASLESTAELLVNSTVKGAQGFVAVVHRVGKRMG